MYEVFVVCSVGIALDPDWNSLEKYEQGQTLLLRYSNMVTQPWVSLKNPFGHLWVVCLKRAIDAGFVSEDKLAR